MLTMQHQDGSNGVQQPGRIPYKSAMNGDHTGFSHGAFHSHHGSLGGYSERHPQRQNIPNINTARLAQQQAAEMQTPGTAYDMNFTPLLPSQLLLGSPFQPGSPNAFGSPQFQSFNSFAAANGIGQMNGQTNGQHMGSPVQQHASMNSSVYQNMTSPNGMNVQPYMAAPHSPTTPNPWEWQLLYPCPV